MRFRYFLAGAAVLVVLGVLGFRILDLEQRVALLSEANKRQDADGSAPTTTQSATSASNATSATIEARLRTIEQRISALENMKQGLATPSGNMSEDRLRQEQAILSVVERENGRIRDVQLEWHKARWLETRKQQLAAFAFSQKLEPAQSVKLYDAIEGELTGLVEIMKRPSFAEEPDQVANDWLGILGQTDKRAQELLSPAQYQTWLQGRFFERKVLWPWLPETPPETAQR
ncbi:MAG TPA: hypothetical protein VFN67_26085 [Polyangiales bacterium]|nr:hypothetical protein [Polyangiales bacterium]